MCKDSTSTTTQKVPKYIEQAGKDLWARATGVADQPFEAYTGPRVADLSGDQGTAFQMLRDMAVGGTPDVLGEALAGARTYGAAPAQKIGSERVVDETGRLGAIADYLNPYIGNTLDPAIRRIMEAADIARKRTSAGATAAGAFGDARHGIVESGINRDTTQAVGDTTYKAYADAFGQAMNQRAADLGRFTEADRANAALMETALGRGFTGSGALLDRAGQDQGNLLERLQALLGSGALQQNQEQRSLDAAYEEFLRGAGYDEDMIRMLTSALSGVPYTKTIVSTEPDNSGLGIAGALLSSGILGPLASAGGTGGGLFGAGQIIGPATAAASDIRLKRDIHPIGRLPNGIRLYRFRYLWSDDEMVGVIAQEVLKTAPEAVIIGSDGYLKVDYRRLGLRMMSMAEWRARESLAA